MDVFDFQTAVIKQFNRNFTMHSMYILVISVLIMHMYMAAMIKYMILYRNQCYNQIRRGQ